jgi:hypothetical protein
MKQHTNMGIYRKRKRERKKERRKPQVSIWFLSKVIAKIPKVILFLDIL